MGTPLTEISPAQWAAQWTPARAHGISYHSWLGIWVPHVGVTYPQWEAQNVNYSAPLLGPLAWVAGGDARCAGCGNPLDAQLMPAMWALCPSCLRAAAKREWRCVERVTTGKNLECGTPLDAPACHQADLRPQTTTQEGPGRRFAETPPCVSAHELVVLWFAPGRARACILPTGKVGAAIAASGALLARRYHVAGCVTFLAEWQLIVKLLQEPPKGRLKFCSFPRHAEVTAEAYAALSCFTETPPEKFADLYQSACAECFTKVEGALREAHVIPFAESWAPRRYFLPRRLPRQRALLTPVAGRGILPLVGTGIGSWGPWVFLRQVGGKLVQFNVAAILGREVCDSPELLAGDRPATLEEVQAGEEIPALHLLGESQSSGTFEPLAEAPRDASGGG